jgi:aspartyl-tRNA(Asn)/glutamyl-tRNA(Gln) amidotransferase subunit A
MEHIPDFRTTTVEALAAAVASGEITARQLTEVTLARIDTHNETLNAFVAIDADAALRQADAIDQRRASGDPLGPLAGIPVGIKDLEDAAGFRTTRGAAHLADSPVCGVDATEVARLRDAGCVVIGKTNTPEAGWIGDTFNPVFGPTVNPWDLRRSPGGSSGGSSAAVSGGLVPLATGSDGGGSIRIPSAVCGMSGFKPSLGRIPAGPTPLGAGDLSTVGPMARRIRDVALALDVVVGPDANDLRSLPHPGQSFRQACDNPAPPTRLLWCPNLDGSEVDTEVLAITRGAVDRLAQTGVEVVEVDPLIPESFGAFLLLFYGSMVPNYRPLMGTDRFAEVTPGLRDVLTMADERLTPDSVEEARKSAQACSVALAEAMQGFDALLTPTTVGQTPVSQHGGTVNGEETAGWVGNTYPLNVTRRPAGTTTAGFAADGMPVGLQLVGHQLADVRTVALTAWAEDVLGFDPVAPFGQ